MKKINESKKSRAGLSNVYTSNIKWLKEMEEVFMNDLNSKTYENVSTLFLFKYILDVMYK